MPRYFWKTENLKCWSDKPPHNLLIQEPLCGHWNIFRCLESRWDPGGHKVSGRRWFMWSDHAPRTTINRWRNEWIEIITKFLLFINPRIIAIFFNNYGIGINNQIIIIVITHYPQTWYIPDSSCLTFLIFSNERPQDSHCLLSCFHRRIGISHTNEYRGTC